MPLGCGAAFCFGFCGFGGDWRDFLGFGILGMFGGARGNSSLNIGVSYHGYWFRGNSSQKTGVSKHGSRFHAYSSLKFVVSKHGSRFHAYSSLKIIVSKHEINFLIEFFGRLPIHIENMARIGRMEISRLFLGLEIDHTTLPATSSSKIALK